MYLLTGKLKQYKMEDFKNTMQIDHFKVIDAILPGVQNYWGERAAKAENANGDTAE